MAYLPWQFPDKWGYLNNPRWTDEPAEEERHIPCGHWHKRDDSESQVWEY